MQGRAGQGRTVGGIPLVDRYDMIAFELLRSECGMSGSLRRLVQFSRTDWFW